jgi:preprotein translocase subunit YajC
MINVVNLVSLIAAPLIVTMEANAAAGQSNIVVILVMVALLGVILFMINRSKQEDAETVQMVEEVASASKS